MSNPPRFKPTIGGKGKKVVVGFQAKDDKKKHHIKKQKRETEGGVVPTSWQEVPDQAPQQDPQIAEDKARFAIPSSVPEPMRSLSAPLKGSGRSSYGSQGGGYQGGKVKAEHSERKERGVPVVRTSVTAADVFLKEEERAPIALPLVAAPAVNDPRMDIDDAPLFQEGAVFLVQLPSSLPIGEVPLKRDVKVEQTPVVKAEPTDDRIFKSKRRLSLRAPLAVLAGIGVVDENEGVDLRESHAQAVMQTQQDELELHVDSDSLLPSNGFNNTLMDPSLNGRVGKVQMHDNGRVSMLINGQWFNIDEGPELHNYTSLMEILESGDPEGAENVRDLFRGDLAVSKTLIVTPNTKQLLDLTSQG